MEDLRPVVDLTGKEFETALSGISKGMSSVDTAPVVGPTLINSGVLLATMSTLISADVDLGPHLLRSGSCTDTCFGYLRCSSYRKGAYT
jgi:hypothetical protein